MREKLSSIGTTTSDTMGVYKLSILDLDPKGAASPTFPKSSFLRGTATTFMGRRFSTKVQPTLRSFLEAPEPDPISTSSSEDDSSSRFTASSGSTRTSNALTSDDDACLRDLSNSLRGPSYDPGSASLARHSTACCTDVALRQELRRKFHIEGERASAGRYSFAMGRCSFRRELEAGEDRVESLALWEDTSDISTSARDCVVGKDLRSQHSWPPGHASSAPAGTGKLGLDGVFRKTKKAKSSFFSTLLSTFSFSTSRRPRKL